MKKSILTFLFILVSHFLMANNEYSSFHQNGKINVVIGVVAIIFIILIVYLILIDRKLSRIENSNKKDE